MVILRHDQTLQDLFFYLIVFTFLFQNNVQRFIWLIWSDSQPKIVIIVQLIVRLNDEFFAKLLLLVVVKVRVKHKRNTPIADRKVAQIDSHPLSILLQSD